MTTIYLVTHTESTHHIEDRVGGWFDSELTERGLRQAELVAQAIAPKAPAATVWSSDLKRAVQTATPIARACGTRVNPKSDLREMSFGVAEGRDQAWLESRLEFPPPDATRIDHRIVEGAESRRDLAVRIERFLSHLLTRPPESAVIVTHRFAASFVLASWIGMPPSAAAYVEFGLTSGGISTLERKEPWCNRRLARLNDTSHLT